MSGGDLRDYAPGPLVIDRWLQLMFFDHSIIILTHFFDMKSESHYLKAVLQFLAHHSSGFHGLGFAKSLQSSFGQLPPIISGVTGQTGKQVFSGQEPALENGIAQTLGEIPFRQHTIIGRGTLAVKATVKDAHQPGTMSPEQRATLEAGVFVKFARGSQSRESEAIFVTYARETMDETTECKKFLDRLPGILHTKDGPLSKVAERPSKEFGELYECRILRITVSETLSLITGVKDADDFKRTMLEIIECKYLRC